MFRAGGGDHAPVSLPGPTGGGLEGRVDARVGAKAIRLTEWRSLEDYIIFLTRQEAA